MRWWRKDPLVVVMTAGRLIGGRSAPRVGTERSGHVVRPHPGGTCQEAAAALRSAWRAVTSEAP